MLSRDEYVGKMKHQLDELNGKIDELEAKGKVANTELHGKYDETMAELREHAAAAGKKMEEIKDAGEDKWEALVEEGEKVQKAFVSSFNYFKSQFK